AFRKAHELKSTRTELMGLWLEAKRLMEDWIGVIDVTRLADAIEPSADSVYYRAQAYTALAGIALASGRQRVALDHYLKGGQEIADAFRVGHAKGRVLELRDLRIILFRNFVLLTDQMSKTADEHIEVWRAVVTAFGCFVRGRAVVKLGVDRL